MTENDENDENEWICHYISNLGLKGRKSKAASFHYSKKKTACET